MRILLLHNRLGGIVGRRDNDIGVVVDIVDVIAHHYAIQISEAK
jgi:hypothetical protein